MAMLGWMSGRSASLVSGEALGDLVLAGLQLAHAVHHAAHMAAVLDHHDSFSPAGTRSSMTGRRMLLPLAHEPVMMWLEQP